MLDFDAIWTEHLTGRSVGAFHELKPDMLFAHEATLSLVLSELREANGPKVPVEKLFFVLDHFAPPSNPGFADIVRDVRSFCREFGIPLRELQGIGHMLMLESDEIRPGDLVLGADSHTTTIGGKGAVGVGLGSTDILAALLTGTAWLKKPPVAFINVRGRLSPGVEARDGAMHLLQRKGQGGFLGEVMEYHVPQEAELTIAERSVFTNLCVEMGAVTALAVECTGNRSAPGDFSLHLDRLVPSVARPGRPDDVVPADSLNDVCPDWVVIGSCAAGSLADLERAANILGGRRKAPQVGLLVTPGSNEVYREAMASGVLERLLDAGATLLNPSCGACGGIDKGIPAIGDVVLSTAPRNFLSRQRKGASVYLSSASVAAATALTGRITDPREVMP